MKTKDDWRYLSSMNSYQKVYNGWDLDDSIFFNFWIDNKELTMAIEASNEELGVFAYRIKVAFMLHKVTHYILTIPGDDFIIFYSVNRERVKKTIKGIGENQDGTLAFHTEEKTVCSPYEYDNWVFNLLDFTDLKITDKEAEFVRECIGDLLT